jgi:hypothetical protein
MNKIILFSFYLFFALVSFSQKAPKDLEKLIGTWKYSQGSGFEIWKQDGLDFFGRGMVLNKSNDTIYVEKQEIKYQGNFLYYTSISNSENAESEKTYISKGKKLVFYNTKNDLPLSITFKFKFWSKNKLLIKIKHTEKSKEVVLKLNRVE